ncbi:MAG TPA: hypothetical protein VFQ39_05585, partial [Longimicrobium sp.]|nr:hypothetical protein [Longimicrobium sp.]
DSLETALDLPEPGAEPPVSQEQTSGADSGSVKAPPRAAPADSAAAARAAPAPNPRARADSLRAARAAWLEKITPRYDSAAERKRGEAGQVEKADTTDAAGRAELDAGEGKWWVVASYVLPDHALEWYLPVTVRGDSIVVTLDRANAKSRPISY